MLTVYPVCLSLSLIRKISPRCAETRRWGCGREINIVPFGHLITTSTKSSTDCLICYNSHISSLGLTVHLASEIRLSTCESRPRISLSSADGRRLKHRSHVALQPRTTSNQTDCSRSHGATSGRSSGIHRFLWVHPSTTSHIYLSNRCHQSSISRSPPKIFCVFPDSSYPAFVRATTRRRPSAARLHTAYQQCRSLILVIFEPRRVWRTTFVRQDTSQLIHIVILGLFIDSTSHTHVIVDSLLMVQS